MNISKIIKEEIDGFDWVKDISHELNPEQLNLGDSVRITWDDNSWYEETTIYPLGSLPNGGVYNLHSKNYTTIDEDGSNGWEYTFTHPRFKGSFEIPLDPNFILYHDGDENMEWFRPQNFNIKMEYPSIQESNDFDWVKNVEEYVILTRLSQLKIGNKYYIDYRVGYNNERLKIPVIFTNRPRPNMSSYVFLAPDEKGKNRNYLFFKRGSGGGGIQDMIEDGQVFYKKSELKEEVNEFDWVREYELSDIVDELHNNTIIKNFTVEFPFTKGRGNFLSPYDNNGHSGRIKSMIVLRKRILKNYLSDVYGIDGEQADWVIIEYIKSFTV